MTKNNKKYFDSKDYLSESDQLKTRLIIQIEKARISQNLSQAQIAQRANISQGQYSRIENLESSPNLETIIKLAHAVGKKLELTDL